MTDDDRLTWGFIHRRPRRPGTPRLPPQRQRAHRPGHRAHPRRGPDLRGHPGRSPAAATSWCRHPRRPHRSRPARPARTPSSSRPAEVKTLLAALDDAAEYKRDRAETCADCAGQSCTTCQWRLQAADAYDQMAGQMIQPPRPPPPGSARPATRRLASAGPHAAADPEAGQ